MVVLLLILFTKIESIHWGITNGKEGMCLANSTGRKARDALRTGRNALRTGRRD
jgi:hypothetical protein